MKLAICFCIIFFVVSVSCGTRIIGQDTCIPCILESAADAMDLKRFKPVKEKNALDEDSKYAKHALVNQQQEQRAHHHVYDAGAVLRMRKWPKQRHDKRYVSCEYGVKTSGIRHARSATPPDAYNGRGLPPNKRRLAVSDLTLCHFKICNMGRKRTIRFINN